MPAVLSLAVLLLGGLLATRDLVSAQVAIPKRTQLDEPGIKQARLSFSEQFVSANGLKELTAAVARERNIDRIAELKGLLEAFPFPAKKELILESLEKRRFEASPFLRTKVLLNTEGKETPEQLAELIKIYPHDFLLHSRFAFLSMMNGSHKKEVFDAVSAVERLTDNHPMALFLRAQRERITRLDDPDLWKKTSKALIYYKLVNYAAKLVSTKAGVEDSIESITRYLQKNGITPPEPTAEQYAAVKKRGWAFNKQMLEPFKKVD